jgi:hypothetical protein
MGVGAATAVKVTVAPTVALRFVGCVVNTNDTVSVPALLVAVPALFVATHRYWFPFMDVVALVTTRVGVVTLEYGAAFVRSVHVDPPLPDTCHCNVGGGVPTAPTENVAFDPTRTVWSDG